jgi:adenosylcobinamide-GDP ribazoletransferase
MRNIFKGFALAMSMLTIVPMFKIHDFYKGINGYAVMFYPLVGFILGAILWGLHSLLNPYVASTHLGVIIFALWVLLTGALHLDGFSDTVDGLYVKKERALEVMKDSHVGGMGMIMSVTFLILKASSLTAFEAFYLLPLILMLSRLNAVLAIYFYPYISQNGMGTLAKEEFTKPQLLIALFYSFLVVLLYNKLLLLVSALLALFVIKQFFMKRYGGFSGDIYGFLIEVTELFLLNVLLLGLLA